MANADGDIQLSVGISTEDAKRQAVALSKTVANIFNSVDSSKMTTAMKKAQAAMSKTESQIDSVTAKIAALEEQEARAAEYADSFAALDSAEQQLAEFKKSLEEATKAGDPEKIKEWTEKVKQGGELIWQVRDYLEDLEAQGKVTFTQDDVDQLTVYKNQLGDLNNQLRLNIESYNALAEAAEKATPEQSQLSQQEVELQRAADVIRGDLNPAVAELLNKFDENNRKIAELRQEMAQLESEGKGIGYKEYDEKAAALSRLEAAQSQINADLDEYKYKLSEQYQQEQEIAAGEQAYQNILRQTSTIRNQGIAEDVARINELKQNIEDMKAKQQELQDMGYGPGTAYFDELTQKIGAAKQEITELQKNVDAYNENLVNGTNKASKALSALKTAGKGAGNAILSITKVGLQLSPVGRVVDTLKSKFKNLGSAIKKTASQNTDFGKSMSSSIKKILSYGLGIASVAALFKKLRSAIKDGVNNLVQTNGGINQTNQAISSLMASLNALKNAWGAAFAPVIQVVAPILTRLVDMFTGVVGKISQFISAITGRSTALVAKKTDFNYASSLDKSGKASGKSQEEKYNKAVDKAQEKYDEKVKKTEAKNAEAAAKAEEKQAKAAEKLAKKQEKANQQLGEYDQLNVIAKDDAEELEDIQATQYEMPELEMPDMSDYMTGMTDFDSMFEEVPIESAISDLINRLKEAWENADFTQFGRDVAQKIKELSDEATKWLVNVAQPFAEKLGTSLGTFINGLTEDGEVALSAGRTIGEGLNTITTGINAFLDSVDWEQVGTFLADGFNGLVDAIDWQALGHMFIMKWNALFETLDGFAKEFDFKKLGAGIGEGIETMFKDFDAASLGSAIGGWVAGIFETITGFFEQINWFELGQTIIQKIVDMITGVDWGRVFTAIFEALGAALGGVSALLFGLMEKVGELLVGAWNSMVDWFLENAVTESGEFTIEGFLNGIIDALKNIGQWIVDHIFKPFIDGFKKAFGIQSPSKEMKSMGDMLMQGLKEGINDKIQSVVQVITTLKTKVVNVFNSMKTSVITTWNNLWTGIKRVVNSIITGVEKMVNGIINGINKMINGINSLNIDIPDWIPEEWGGGNSIGFNIPTLSSVTIPRLAQGGVIPPNKQFLAMLGDQKSGTNIEAPLDTMIEAFNRALDERNASNHEPIVLQLEGKTIAQVVWDEEDKRYKQRGVSYTPIFTT